MPAGQPLSAAGATALYISALMGPSLMLIPGLATDVAGPASLVAWLVLIALSGAFALIFAELGVHIRRGGITGYARVGLGSFAARVVTWCFIGGTVVGTPYVCPIGGSYYAQLFGLSRLGAALTAAGLLVVILALAASGARIGIRIQMLLVSVLIAVVLIGVAGALPHGSAANWTPFLPNGWMSIGSAASLVIMGFIGWESIAPLIGRLPRPRQQLPRIIATAFGVTTAIYLAVVIATISVLGAHPGAASLVALLDRALGGIGAVLAAAIAAILTVASSHAYITGTFAAAVAASGGNVRLARRWFYGAVIAANAAFLAAFASGTLNLDLIIRFPAALALTIYLVCALAAARLFRGALRVTACASAVVALVVLLFTTTALVAPALVVAAVALHAAWTKHGRGNLKAKRTVRIR